MHDGADQLSPDTGIVARTILASANVALQCNAFAESDLVESGLLDPHNAGVLASRAHVPLLCGAATTYTGIGCFAHASVVAGAAVVAAMVAKRWAHEQQEQQ